jgi:hypothetical protein
MAAASIFTEPANMTKGPNFPATSEVCGVAIVMVDAGAGFRQIG